MGDQSEVVLLNNWASLFGIRVKIALAEKGIKYDHKDEDLRNKSSQLLEMNPVHKKIPILIHKGKPICESNIIVQYIDDAWNNKSPSLLPSDPYLKSQARFWADFVDNKIYPVWRKIWETKGEEQESAKKDFIGYLKVLEGQLGDKPYLIGESFGYADIAFISFSSSFYMLEKIGNISVEKECPKLAALVKRCMERDSVSKSLGDPHKIYEFFLGLRNKLAL